jgi:hypothetical protein
VLGEALTARAPGVASIRGSGIGTGADPLSSQGLLILKKDNRLLLAVNAESDSVSAFELARDKLKLNKVDSVVIMPVSVAVRCDLVYVLK